MLRIDDDISIPEQEIEFSAVRSQGAGGQNVNKVASAIHLRFDIRASSLPAPVKERLLRRGDQRITAEGVVVIKAQNHRTQDRNRAEALSRLQELVRQASRLPRKRIATRPSRAAREKRLQAKKRRASLKKLRSGEPD
ncbi:MAG: alternative ribosome rescue aminoacyl-tRNA hydrolase ArfB [Xanthomonadales bacterium]|nr:alternative ribosome rescue aminoacyl-tRNA hydrolase ArfB [Xanthomonadales bacterium]